MSEKTLPVKHLSARVPWHDNKWNGKVCNNPTDNSFCRILARIDSIKDPDAEDSLKNQNIDDTTQPPCVHEKGTFLSPNSFIRVSKHAWTDINPLYKDFLPCNIVHKPYSFNAVPFLWMMKTKSNESPAHHSEKAAIYGLDYDPDLEAKIDAQLGFEGNMWIQHPENQKALLNGFFGCLKPMASLVFFYAKHTPLSEPNSRVIIGAARIKTVGDLLEYNYPPNYKGHRGYVWDRIITHSLTDKNPDGVLLPYHDILDFVEKNDLNIDLSSFAVYAPDFMQFSYASELVEHDTAIDALFAMAEHLKKASELLGETFKKELDWIDNEISKIWDMRGAFPGIGPVLTAMKISNGNTISWEIEKNINEKDGDLYQTDPWHIFEESVAEPKKHLGAKGDTLFDSTVTKIWKLTAPKKKVLIKLLSRCQLTNEQADFIINNTKQFTEKESDILENPYLLYERTRFNINGLTFKQIDKAILPAAKIREAFPLDSPSKMEDDLDIRRLRALAVHVLERAAEEGHSILPFNDFLSRIQAVKLESDLPITDDVLTALLRDDFIHSELVVVWDDGEEEIRFVKLQRLAEVKNLILSKLDIDNALNKPYGIEKDWLGLVNSFPDFAKQDEQCEPDEIERLARKEKAEALRILCNYKVSVLIGPAGSGKTTLLKIFQSIPEVKNGGIIKLAPTGKARVKLGHNAKTVAQYLYHERYDIETGRYHPNEDAQKDSSAETIIIDESSMLTEEALAAVFDKLGFVKRIILVGDYRQLPPIGTGRPFVDIVNRVKPASFKDNIIAGPCYAELRQIRRQQNSQEIRPDIILSRCFGDEIDKFDLETFRRIASENFKNEFIRLEKWYDTKDFRELFDRVLREELELSEEEPEKDFNRKIGAKDHGAYQYFNYDSAEKVIENWQIITPNNGFAHGVKEVNKFIQKTYRKSFIDLALNVKKEGQTFPNKRRIAKPKGADNFVYGDKVINLKNTNWGANQGIKPKEKKETALNYIANGEIGVVTGEFCGNKSSRKGEPNVEIAFSTQPGYSYVFWPKSLDEDGKYPIDLAYAITIHKAQGSGFKKVFLILPAKGQALSRELFYTALTRQEDKIIILHQGPFRDFLKFASPLASSTSRRFTDLFFEPAIKEINNKYYDPRYINVSERGERMISKSEVIIANCLNKYKNELTYAYEDKLKLESYEKTIKPDFTIQNLKTGRVFYWEHCGMMTLQHYREKWAKKLEAYKKDGFVDFRTATAKDEKVLIVTEDTVAGGVDSQYFDSIVRKYILGY